MNERGSVTLLVLAVALAVGAMGAAVTGFAQVVGARWQATAAADAAALAAAPATFRSGLSPSVEASRYAQLNGAKLIACDCPAIPTWAPRVVRVLVEVDVEAVLFGHQRVRAESRAEFRPTQLFVP